MDNQNIYDDPQFFEGYAQLNRSKLGLEGAPEWPAIERLLPPLSGKTVVDLGCGYGWFCRKAKEKGAQTVLGIDQSEKMLEKAKALTRDDDNITYLKAHLEQLTLPQKAFDLAYSSLTLHYIADISPLLQTIHQAIKDNGNFIFSVEHPIYTAGEQPQWLWTENNTKIWPVHQYQKEGKRLVDWFVPDVIKQHRTLGTYLNGLIQAGFKIQHVEEWGPTEAQIELMPDLEEEKERPMLLLVKASKA